MLGKQLQVTKQSVRVALLASACGQLAHQAAQCRVLLHPSGKLAVGFNHHRIAAFMLKQVIRLCTINRAKPEVPKAVTAMHAYALHKQHFRLTVFCIAGKWRHFFAKVYAGARMPARVLPDVACYLAGQMHPYRVGPVQNRNLPEAILNGFAQCGTGQAHSCWLPRYLHYQGIALQGYYFVLPIAAGSCFQQAKANYPNYFLKTHCNR